MNREIKFKGLWETLDGSKKEWAYYQVGAKPQLVGAKWITPDLEYIGLKDKNGKEIFEGDIVQGGSTHYIDWNKGQSQWWLYWRDGLEAISLTKNESVFIEIIGNIFENPDLLRA